MVNGPRGGGPIRRSKIAINDRRALRVRQPRGREALLKSFARQRAFRPLAREITLDRRLEY
jgi:hypothetical protein